MTRALITGIAGQDGSYLAELLLAEGCEVHGIVRPPLERTLANIEPIRERLTLHAGDLLDPKTIRAAIELVAPDEIYHLAAPTFVPDSWNDPATTFEAITGATARLLEDVRELAPATRVLVAGSREMFGDTEESPQNEQTQCRPNSPYGIAKLASHELVGVLRERHGLHASSAILYNHESPRRPVHFVTRRVTRAAAAISLGLEQELEIGDLDAVRDWSAAVDVMAGLVLIVRNSEPGDFVLSSGVARTVSELVQTAFDCAGIEVEGHVRSDPSLVRRREANPAVGDPSRAAEVLGWRVKTDFKELIAEMVTADLAALAAAVPPR